MRKPFTKKSNATTATGPGPTVVVAVEQFFPEEERGITDDLALSILPWAMRCFVRLIKFAGLREKVIQAGERKLPGIWGDMICRKRYIDDKLAAVAEEIGSVVNLGAGFDTRWNRVALPESVDVFEVDYPVNVQAKTERLRHLFGSVPGSLKLISLDFGKTGLGQALEGAGYVNTRKTFFIMEGVTQYVSEGDLRSTFSFLASAAPGSHLVFTYIRGDFLRGKELYGWEEGYRLYVEEKKIWVFGAMPGQWPSLLREYHWEVLQDISCAELVERYLPPRRRELASSPVERILYARKMED